MLNEYCQQRGVDYHADHRSNTERGLAPAEVLLARWNIVHHKRTGQKTAAMEKRDRERVARAEIARLEAEREELEQEHARAREERASSTDAPSAIDIGPQPSRPTGDVRTPNRSVRTDEPIAMPELPNLAKSELPGPRYGP